jgi:hypothetical protein
MRTRCAVIPIARFGEHVSDNGHLLRCADGPLYVYVKELIENKQQGDSDKQQ